MEKTSKLILVLLFDVVFHACAQEITLPRILLCERKLDWIFVLDGSGSVGLTNFDTVRETVKRLISVLPVEDPEGANVGVIVYGTEVDFEHFIHLQPEITEEELLRQVSELVYPGTGTATYSALEQMRNDITAFSRPDALKVGMVITDGKSNRREETIQQASRIKSQGVLLAAIGIGYLTDQDELRAIASNDNVNFFFEDFTRLVDQVQRIAEQVCATLSTCNPFIDVVFVLDSSTSTRRGAFEDAKTATKLFANHFTFNQISGVRIGVVVFNTGVRAVIPLSQFLTEAEFAEQVDALQYTTGDTEVAAGLRQARIMLANQNRPDARRYVILITDGFLQDIDEALSEADTIKGEGVTVVSLNLEKISRMINLENLSSGPKWTLTYADYPANSHLMSDVATLVCNNGECPPGSYGVRCALSCGNCRNGDVCDTRTGNCPNGCADGYTGDECHERCRPGFYGPDCQVFCGKCLNSDPCDVITGQCPNGCKPGFIPPMCVEGCGSDASCLPACGHCENDEVCDPITADCPGNCEVGYKPPKCTEVCDPGTYGLGCTGVCDECQNNDRCSPINGLCPGEGECYPGFPDKYGPSCELDCGHCKDGAQCERENGYCPDGCDPGYQGLKCDNECPDGTYGPDCVYTCGQCRDGELCRKTDGLCPNGCEDGYTDPACDRECPGGTYGTDCSSNCGHCRDDAPCDNVNGVCPNGCEDGFYGDRCNYECPDGTYGPGCSLNCGQCRNAVPCQKDNGRCPDGCEDGFINSKCDEEKPSGDPTLCSECRWNHGVGYAQFQQDCTKFIQCIRVRGFIRSTFILDCGVGLFWDQDLMVCNYPRPARCLWDQCYTYGVERYTRTNSCRLYWTCVGSVTEALECCPQGTAFIDGSCQGGQQGLACTEECPFDNNDNGEEPDCYLEAVPDDERLFIQHYSNGLDVQFKCPNNRAFVQEDCDCTKNISGQTCIPELLIDFDGGVFDKSFMKLPLLVNNVAVVGDSGALNGYAGRFRGDSQILCWRFANTDFGENVYIRIRYKPDTNNIASSQVLLTNGGCQNTPSIVLGYNSQTSRAQGVIETNEQDWTPLDTSAAQPSTWQVLEYVYSGGNLEITTRSDDGTVISSSNGPISGPVRRVHGAIQIGFYDCNPPEFVNLNALIDEVAIYLCIP